MARKKRYNKKDIRLLIGFSVISVILIVIYSFYSNKDPYNNVKIDKRLDIVYTVYENDNFLVPAINVNDVSINDINQMIIDKANTYLKKEGSSISYNYSINGEVLSLAIQYIELDKFKAPVVSFDTFNINLFDKHILTDEEILSKISVTDEEIYNIVGAKFQEFYKDEVSKKILDQECNYECFLFMRGIENNNYLENRKLYLNNGDLYVLKSFNIYTVLNEERYFTFDDYLFQITD